jgi:hypothetical protein
MRVTLNHFQLPGVTGYYEFVKSLREAYILQPAFFNDELLQATYITENDHVDNWPSIVDGLCLRSPAHREAYDSRATKHVTIYVEISSDGVTFRKETSQMPQMIPTVARVAALVLESGSSQQPEQRFVFKRHPPFLVGYYIGTCKPKTRTIMSMTVKELIKYSPLITPVESPTAAERLSVRTLRFQADGPARTDVKGVLGHGGYNSLPRCLTVGERHHGRVCYPGSSCTLRVDDDWESYKKSPVGVDICH